MNLFKTIALFLICVQSLYANVDLVIFSYDRPLQLYALLESIDLNIKGLNRETVIYRSSSDKFDSGYQLLKEAFPHVVFKQQDHHNAKVDFKPLLVKSLFDHASKARYALFAVDDIVVTRPIDLGLAASQMEENRAYCFFFRLGLNIDHCYMTNTYSGLPRGIKVEPNLFSWKIADGRGDWNYPNNVDLTLYRKEDIRPFFVYYPYTFPNDLEANWATLARGDVRGLCYTESCMVNLPLNVVSNFRNRQMSYKTTAEFLELFMEGYKMDIKPLQGIKNHSPHFEVEPQFVLR